MELKYKLNNDMKVAMKSRDKNYLNAVRSIIGEIKKLEIDSKIEANDKDVLQVINKMVKQRKDSINQFTNAGRADLVDIEKNELDVIMLYMPKQLSYEEIVKEVENVVNSIGSTSMADIGKFMTILKVKLQGVADMSIVSKVLKNKLN